MFEIGDLVRIFAPAAGKKKYHLCVCCADKDGVEKFLFINSAKGYKGDFVLDDGAIDCLPPGPTGFTVISCSMVIRYTLKQLNLFRAEKIGEFPRELLSELIEFVEKNKALSGSDRKIVLVGLKYLRDS